MGMRLAKTLVPLAFILLVVAGPVEAVHRSAPAKWTLPAVWEEQLRVYIETESDTSGAFLSLDANASTTAAFRANGDVASGAQMHLQRATGSSPRAVYEFPLRAPLPQDYFLNLTKRVYGVVYVSNAPSQAVAAAGRGVEHGALRFELLQGADRVVGTEFHLSALMAASPPATACVVVCIGSTRPTLPWIPIYFETRPEVRLLRQGEPLLLKITRTSGASDLLIGTHGDQQSFIEFRYYDNDPVAGLLYLEKGRLISSTTGQSLTSSSVLVDKFLEEAQRIAGGGDGNASGPYFLQLDPGAPERHPSALGALALGFPGFLFLFSRPRRRRAALIAALVFATALAGCAGGSADAPLSEPTGEDGRPAPTVRQEIVDAGNGTSAENGTLEGIIRDNSPVALPIKGAYIAILSTNHFADSAKDGSFRMPDVAPGAYTIRVDAKGFNSLEHPNVVVEAGKTTRLNITLGRLGVTSSNKEAHLHGDWGEETRKLVHDVSFVPEPTSYEKTTYGRAYAQSHTVGGNWVCPLGGHANANSYGYTSSGGGIHYCSASVPIDRKNLLPPGTGAVEIVLDWSTAGQSPDELSIHTTFFSGAGKYGYYYSSVNDPLLPRGPKVPFFLPFFPNYADVGHVKATRWGFSIALPFYEHTHPSQEVFASLGSVNMKVYAHKSVVPFEPPHPDFWGNQTTRPLVLNNGDLTAYVYGGSSMAQYAVYYGSTSWPNSQSQFYVTWPNTFLVPPGTATIKGTITWTASPDTGAKWSVAYRTPLIPYDYYRQTFKNPASSTTTGSTTTFEIQVDPAEADPFYASSSGWGFYVSDQEDTATRASGYATPQALTLKLRATVEKDPGFTD